MGRELYHFYWHCAQIIIFTKCPEFLSPPKVEKSMRRVNTSNTYSNTNINNSYSINIKVSITSVYWRGKFDYQDKDMSMIEMFYFQKVWL